MGRELKRVSLEFKWPLKEKWVGYVNPYYPPECKECESGYNEETQKIDDEWYGFHKSDDWVYVEGTTRRWNRNSWQYNLTQEDVDALIESNRLVDLTHDYVSGEGWVEKTPKHHPTADEVNERARRHGACHDSINKSICVKARAEREGVYGFCDACNGENRVFGGKEHEDRYNNWERFDPPAGEGYQMWETTSEGSPMTPVFESLRELCEWCETNASVFGTKTFISKEEWFEVLTGEKIGFEDKENGIIWI